MKDVKEFITTEDHRVLEVPPVADMCEMIQLKYNRMMKECEKLWVENERLKAETYKDEELKKWRDKYNEMREIYYDVFEALNRGFEITEEEDKKIEEFVKEHDKMHGYAGAVGGRYTYNFLPTSIGTAATIKCNSCEKTMTFRELD